MSPGELIAGGVFTIVAGTWMWLTDRLIQTNYRWMPRWYTMPRSWLAQRTYENDLPPSRAYVAFIAWLLGAVLLGLGLYRALF